jgi:hypothetical protein
VGEGCWWLAMSATERGEGGSGSRNDYVNALYIAARSKNAAAAVRAQ